MINAPLFNANYPYTGLAKRVEQRFGPAADRLVCAASGFGGILFRPVCF
jgi:hypothetical protein